MKKYNNIKLGADPEFFIFNTIEDRIISAESLIGGTKDDPKQISEVGHSIQEDNVMAEFNIPPAIDAKSFSRDIQFVISYIDNMLPEHIVPRIVSSAFLDPEFLVTPQAQTFGCDPDLNVWKQEQNEAPCGNTNLRTCGGHIHVGYSNPELEMGEDVIKAMDLFLGVPSILLDTDTERRKMYGKAGAFRFKEYGVEYRTLSNFWIATDELREWAFNNTISAINFIEEGNSFSEELGDRIVNCINNQDVELAKELIEEFNINIIEIVKDEKLINAVKA